MQSIKHQLELNNSQIRVFMTPVEFIDYFNSIYFFDDEIGAIKETTFNLTITLMVLGILGNSNCIIVFLHRKLIENKFNWYLLIVACFKLMFCLILFIDYLYSKIHDESMFLHDLNGITNKTIDFILHTSDACISLLTLILSLDRLYAIKKPMYLKEFITHSHAKYLIATSLIILISISAINYTICEFHISQTHVIYCTIISPTLFKTIPLLMILIFNVLLIIEVIKYNRNRTNSFSTCISDLGDVELNRSNLEQRCSSLSQSTQVLRKSSNRRTNIIQKSHYFVIMVIDIWSVFTSIPYYTLNSYFILFHMNFLSIETLVKCQIISSVLFNFNHCVNFLIYLCFYKDFRGILFDFFKGIFLKKH